MIEPCLKPDHITEASAPRKKDADGKQVGDRRLCCNYKALNDITEKDEYTMPTLEQCTEVKKGRIFTKLDLKSGFWQILMAPEDRAKTAFRIGRKLFQWRVMPMGLKNSPFTFQRLMDKVLTGIIGVFVYVYVDDIIIFSDSWDDHLKHIQTVLQRLADANLRLNLPKCQFGLARVKFLGVMISHNQIPRKDKCSERSQLPTRRDERKRQSE